MCGLITKENTDLYKGESGNTKLNDGDQMPKIFATRNETSWHLAPLNAIEWYDTTLPM